MNIKNTVLIVYTDSYNKNCLGDILQKNYDIIFSDLDDALKRLSEDKGGIDAVIVDCTGDRELMLLSKITESADKIPVIAVLEASDDDNQFNALDMGVRDLIYTPFKGEFVKRRVENVILASKLSYTEKLRQISDYDMVTGIYNRNKFFDLTRVMIDEHNDRKFAFVRFDISRFGLINSFFGFKTGDMVLRRIADGLRDISKEKEFFTYGRIDADIFGVCLEFQDKEKLEADIEKRCEGLNGIIEDYSISLIIGVYIIDDNKMNVDTMCARATLPVKNVKDAYTHTIRYYNDDMTISIKTKQEIINEMTAALEQGQFVPYFQPKYELTTDKPVGAEALVRWIHPKKGVLTPINFIPLFERNGFITKLDAYIWEEVCKYMAKWKKKGLPLFPISVNVSRVNLYNPNLVNIITSLTEKYGIEPKYLNLELTESLYTEMNAIIDRATEELQEKGFTIMMDDFGSGYSSLNVLKDVNVDVLKIDMRFLSRAKKEGRAENILASVVRMAKWLNLPVIAEGVDKKEQVDFLRGVGCEYIQGYYFAKPMPADEYEALIAKQEAFKEHKGSDFNGEELWSSSNMKSVIESVAMPTGIFEYSGERRVDVVSVNKSFYEEFGYGSFQLYKPDVLRFVAKNDREIVLDAVKEAIKTQGSPEVVCRIILPDNGRKWLRIRLKCYGKTDFSHIIIANFRDITDERVNSSQLSFFQNSVLREKNRQRNILVVSPFAEDRGNLVGMLSDKYTVFPAKDCNNGLEVLACRQIDLVILDTENCVGDPEAFIKDIRRYEDDDRTSVVAAITDISPENQERVYAVGADDFIVKPFVSVTVSARIGHLLGGSCS